MQIKGWYQGGRTRKSRR